MLLLELFSFVAWKGYIIVNNELEIIYQNSKLFNTYLLLLHQKNFLSIKIAFNRYMKKYLKELNLNCKFYFK